MTIAWSTIEDAVHTWVVASSGFSAGQVVHSRQGGARPVDINQSWVEISFPFIRKIGQDSQKVSDAAVPAPGAEIEILTGGLRWGVLRLTCYAGEASSTTATGSGSPLAVLEAVVSGAGTQTRLAALNAAGIGILSSEQILNIDGVLGSVVFEPRATVDMQISVPSNIVETETYIDTVNIKSNATGHPDMGIDTIVGPIP